MRTLNIEHMEITERFTLVIRSSGKSNDNSESAAVIIPPPENSLLDLTLFTFVRLAIDESLENAKIGTLISDKLTVCVDMLLSSKK